MPVITTASTNLIPFTLLRKTLTFSVVRRLVVERCFDRIIGAKFQYFLYSGLGSLLVVMLKLCLRSLLFSVS